MNNVLKYAFVAVGGYLLYQHYISGAAAAVSPTTPATGTNPSPTPTTTTTTPPVTPSAATTRQMLITAAGNPMTQSFHQWNYWYQAVRGVAAPAPEDVGQGNGARLITVDEYLSAIAAKGLS